MKKWVACLLGVLLLVSAVAASPPSVTVNKTYVIDNGGATPFNIWVGAILLGLALFVISFVPFPHGEEGLISIMSWIPLAFAMFASFTVDSVSSSVGAGAVVSGTQTFTMIETHTIHHYDTIAVILLILLACAIGNTYRIWVNGKRMQEMTNPQETWHDRNAPLNWNR